MRHIEEWNFVKGRCRLQILQCLFEDSLYSVDKGNQLQPAVPTLAESVVVVAADVAADVVDVAVDAAEVAAAIVAAVIVAVVAVAAEVVVDCVVRIGLE